MRQIVLDTETTGLEHKEGHRIIEIGCVELVQRRLTRNNYHQYLQPDREIDSGAVEVHGITNEFLADKPRFGDIVEGFLSYIEGAELIIHNAPFDVGFINHELQLLDRGLGGLEEHCTILDTLAMARQLHPGQRNSLDALCKRYQVDNSQRDLHGALLDAEILADLYLRMTGGQTSLALNRDEPQLTRRGSATALRKVKRKRPRLKVIRATGQELQRHDERLKDIARANGGTCIWTELESDSGLLQSDPAARPGEER